MADRHPTLTQSYYERSLHPRLTPLAVYLLRLMHAKQTNLCVSADVTTTAELLRVAEETGDHICILKTHADIVSDFGERTIRGLNEIAQRKKFLVFEDRKFGDIGNTVQQQYIGGPLTIVRWAPIVNCHIFPGPAIISALSQAAQQAITAYNTSVHTDISASGAPSVVNSQEDSAERENEVQDSRSAEESEAAEAEDEILEDDSEDSDARAARKQSVVSISTTISMKSEALSPPPSSLHQHRPSLSRTSTSNGRPSVQTAESDDSETPAERLAMLEELGSPPYLRSLLLLAQMSSANNFFSAEYTAACLTQARLHSDFVMGFIAQECLNAEPDDAFITMTPGVQLAAGGDGKGQQYNIPSKVVGEKGTDVIIVGRGVLHAADRTRAAEEYRREGWKAYRERIGRK